MFNKQNNNFARAAKCLIWYTFFDVLHDYDVKFPNATFYGGRDGNMNFSFGCFNL